VKSFEHDVKEFCKKHSLGDQKQAKLLKIVKQQLREMKEEVSGTDSSMVSSMSMIRNASPTKK